MITAVIIAAEPPMMPTTFSHPNGFNEASAIPPMNRSTKTAMFPMLAFIVYFLLWVLMMQKLRASMTQSDEDYNFLVEN